MENKMNCLEFVTVEINEKAQKGPTRLRKTQGGHTYYLKEFQEIFLKFLVWAKGNKRSAQTTLYLCVFPQNLNANKRNSCITPDDPEGSLRVNLSGLKLPHY